MFQNGVVVTHTCIWRYSHTFACNLGSSASRMFSPTPRLNQLTTEKCCIATILSLCMILICICVFPGSNISGSMSGGCVGMTYLKLVFAKYFAAQRNMVRSPHFPAHVYDIFIFKPAASTSSFSSSFWAYVGFKGMLVNGMLWMVS